MRRDLQERRRFFIMLIIIFSPGKVISDKLVGCFFLSSLTCFQFTDPSKPPALAHKGLEGSPLSLTTSPVWLLFSPATHPPYLSLVYRRYRTLLKLVYETSWWMYVYSYFFFPAAFSPTPTENDFERLQIFLMSSTTGPSAWLFLK